MADSKAFQIWEGLPTWAKGAIAVGGVAIVYFTARAIVKKIIGNKGTKQQRATIQDVKNELQQTQNQGVKPTLNDSQFKSMADSIQNAFEGCDPLETSQNTVNRAVKQLKNNADWLKLVEAYGVRTHDQCGWGTGDFTGNLYAAIEDELDSAEKSYVNKLLSERGITYKV